MRRLVLAAIRCYQRYVSPHKGYGCAYRMHTGRHGCSALGYRAVRRFGALGGLKVLRRRLYLCGVAYRRHAEFPRRPHRYQRGDCDPGCAVPCDFDLPSGRTCSTVADVAQCLDCGSCDWPERKKRKTRDQDVYIPPQSTFEDVGRRRGR